MPPPAACLKSAVLFSITLLLFIKPDCHSQQGTNFASYQPGDISERTNYKDKIGPKNSIQKVDSVSHSAGISSYFAKLYNSVMTNVELQLRDFDSATGVFIRKFEIGFADYFLNACTEDKMDCLQLASEWKCLFSHPNAHPLQLTLLGVNAHTNGDMWQALVSNFPEKEIRLYKKKLLAFQASIAKVYFPFFDSLMAQNDFLRFLNSITKRLTRNIGERIIYGWRQRQVKLAIMFYHNPEKFIRKLIMQKKRKDKLDKLILDHISLLLSPH